MRLSHDLPCRFARFVFTFTVAYAWACGAQLARAQAPAPAAGAQQAPARTAEQRAAAAQQLRNGLRAIEAADRDLPRDTFEVAAVVKAVGNDPAKLFEWVRDQTIWVPYRGSLRGDVGVLMDRLGNSLDRSVLLASLLKAAGHEVRLARGTLSLEQAEQALPRLRTPVPMLAAGAAATQPAAGVSVATTPSAGGAATTPAEDPISVAARQFQIDERQSREALDRLVFRQRKTQEAMAERLATQVPRLAELLLPTDAPQVQAAYAASIKEAQDAMRDHWWVQHSEGGKWVDLDPMLADAKPGDHVAPAAVETIEPQKLPPELQCQVEVRVVVERWEAGAAKEATLLRKALRPSQLLGKRVTLSSMPMDWPQDFQLLGQDDLPGRIGRAAVQQREWVPVLSIDGEVTIQSSVKDTGEVIEKPMLTAAHRTGKGTKDAFSGAFDVLSAPAAPTAPKPVAAASHLTAQWLEYETRMPGRPPQVVRREIFDLFGPAARAGEGGLRQFTPTDAAKRERALGMIADTEILALPCRLSEPFVFHLFAQGMAANGPVVTTLMGDEPQDPKALEPLLKKMRPMLSELYGLAMLRQDSPVAAQVYIDRPAILTMRQFFRPPRADTAGDAVGVFKAFDIVSNAVGVHRWSNVPPSGVRLIQGVVDTNAEALAMTDVPREANAADALAAADERGELWVALRAADDAGLAGLKMPEDSRTRIKQDLAAGHVVLGPTIAGEKLTGGVWWRVDPVTGQTLGIGDRGWGATLGEYSALVFFVVFSITMTACSVAVALGADPGGTPAKNVLWCIGLSVMVAAMAVLLFLLGFVAAGGAAGGGAAGGGAVGAGAGAAGGAVGGGAVGGGAVGGGAVGGGAVGSGAVGGGAVGGGAVGGGAVGGGAVGGGAVGGAWAAGPGLGGAAASPLAGTFSGGAIGAGAGGGVVGGGGFVAPGILGATGAAEGGVIVGGGAAGGGALGATGAAGGGVVVGGGVGGGGALAATAAAGTGGAVGAIGAFSGGSAGGTPDFP